jgi:hypothetical protein
MSSLISTSGADPFARFDRGAGLPGLDAAAHFLGREGDELTRHGHGDRGHAQLEVSVGDLLDPDVVLHVVEEFVGKLATTHHRH